MRQLRFFLISLIMVLVFSGVASAQATNYQIITGYAGQAAGHHSIASAQSNNNKITSREEAINHAAQMFPGIIKGKEHLLDVDFRNDEYLGRVVWDINYIRREPGAYRLMLRFDALNGQLLDFNHQPGKYPANATVIDRNEAKRIAEAFIEKHHPDKLDQLVEQERQPVASSYRGSIELAYPFSWYRLVNGIPFDGDMINVGVNALSGKVTRFYCRWREDIEIPGDKAMELEQFINQVVNKLGVYPCYVTTPEQGRLEARLVYRLNSGYSQFDAASGNPVDYLGEEISIAEARLFTQQFTPVTAPETRLDPGAAREPLSPNKLQQIAQSFFSSIGLEGNVRRSGSGRSSGPGYSIEYWNYSLEQDNSSYGYNNIDVEIDIRTGRIVNYRNPLAESRGARGEGVTRDKALETAAAFLAAINPENAKNLVLRDETSYLSDEPVFRFQWSPLVNGIPFMDQYIHVTVDRYTGKVVDYYDRQQPVKSFAGTKDMIDQKQALEALAKARPFVLRYSVPFNPNDPTAKARLVYITEYSPAVDALTGKIINLYGESADPDLYYKKINSHWARLPLMLLANSGLLPEPEAFQPEGSVTRRDVLRVLCALPVDNYYRDVARSPFTDINEDDKDLETFAKAVQFNIVEAGGQLRPEEHLTREDLAVYLVNMLGHRAVAEAPLHIELHYKDAGQINNDKKNFVAIATGLNLVGGDAEGNFRPREPVTWGELASIVVRLVPQLAN